MKQDLLLKLQRESKKRHGFTDLQIREQEIIERFRKKTKGVNWNQLSEYIKKKSV